MTSIEPDKSVEPVDGAAPAAHLAPTFVLARTRSGTTLLQRLLNTSPGLTVWGESAGIIEHFVRAWMVADEYRNNFTDEWKLIDELVGPLADPTRFGPWVSPVTQQRVWEQVRRSLLDLYATAVPADVVWGCKEVRVPGWVGNGLLQLFPRARIVVMIRRPEEWLSSHVRVAWQNEYDPSEFSDGVSETTRLRLEASLDEWIDLYDSYWPLISAGFAGVRVLTYDTLIDAPRKTTEGLQRWLDVEPGSVDLIDRVVAAKAGSADQVPWTPSAREHLETAVAAVVADSRAPTMFADWHGFEARQDAVC